MKRITAAGLAPAGYAGPGVEIGGIRFDRVFYSQNQVAAMTPLCRQTVATMIAAGELDCVRVGKRVLISAFELARLMGVVVPLGEAPTDEHVYKPAGEVTEHIGSAGRSRLRGGERSLGEPARSASARSRGKAARSPGEPA